MPLASWVAENATLYLSNPPQVGTRSEDPTGTEFNIHLAAKEGRHKEIVDTLEELKKKDGEEAAVALARRLAIVMHRMWVDGTEFLWRKEADTAAT